MKKENKKFHIAVCMYRQLQVYVFTEFLYGNSGSKFHSSGQEKISHDAPFFSGVRNPGSKSSRVLGLSLEKWVNNSLFE